MCDVNFIVGKGFGLTNKVADRRLPLIFIKFECKNLERNKNTAREQQKAKEVKKTSKELIAIRNITQSKAVSIVQNIKMTKNLMEVFTLSECGWGRERRLKKPVVKVGLARCVFNIARYHIERPIFK